MPWQAAPLPHGSIVESLPTPVMITAGGRSGSAISYRKDPGINRPGDGSPAVPHVPEGATGLPDDDWAGRSVVVVVVLVRTDGPFRIRAPAPLAGMPEDPVENILRCPVDLLEVHPGAGHRPFPQERVED